MIPTRPGVAAVVVSLLLLGAACSDDDPPDLPLPSDTAPTRDADGPSDDPTDPRLDETYVAQATDDTLVVRTSAQATSDELVTLSAADEISGAIICVVIQQVGDWVEVRLPAGPTDRTGWVARDEVTLSRHGFHIEVSRSAHSLTLYTGDSVVTAPVALGPDAPPAGSRLFIKDLVQPPDPTGAYGPYAYGLSGADNDVQRFAAGSGVVAVHGTADVASLGADAPVGAIAVGNDILTRLVDTIGLPLGTPIAIVE